MGKGYRTSIRKRYIKSIYSRVLNERMVRQIRRGDLYAEMVRLCGLEETERLLLNTCRSDRDKADAGDTPRDRRPKLRILPPLPVDA